MNEPLSSVTIAPLSDVLDQPNNLRIGVGHEHPSAIPVTLSQSLGLKSAHDAAQ